VAAAQAKADQLQEQYLRQKQKGHRLQAELDEVSKTRPPVFLESEESSDSEDGATPSASVPRATVPNQQRPPIPPPASAPGPEGNPSLAPVGTGIVALAGGMPSGSGGILVSAAPAGQNKLGALGALMAVGRKRRCSGGQKGKTQLKSQKEGSGAEGMSDVVDEDSH
jgi:hypothetical protein